MFFLVFSFPRSGLSTDTKKVSFAEMITDDELMSREERCFRLWINSLGISSYVNNLFEDVRNGSVFELHESHHFSLASKRIPYLYEFSVFLLCWNQISSNDLGTRVALGFFFLASVVLLLQ